MAVPESYSGEPSPRLPRPAVVAHRGADKFECSTTDQVAELIARYDLDYWSLFFPLEVPLEGYLEDGPSQDDNETLRLVSGNNIARVDRQTAWHGQGVGVSTANGIDIIAHVDRWKSPIFDRGLSWIHVTPGQPPLVHMRIKPGHGLSASAVNERVQDAFAKATACIAGILRGDPNPPYSQQQEDV